MELIQEQNEEDELENDTKLKTTKKLIAIATRMTTIMKQSKKKRQNMEKRQ